MLWVAWLSGWGMGLSSAGHCFAMCGPIAMSLPFKKADGRTNWWTYSLYHLGRISTYLVIGLLIAGLGLLTNIHRVGSILSVVSGMLLLLMAWNYFQHKNTFNNIQWQFPAKWAQAVWAKTFKSKNPFGYLAAGAVNGLLPCGMVYAAATAAIGSGAPTLVMLGFGMGTLPVFAGFPFFRNWMQKYAKVAQILIPIMLALTGIWLILRGLQPMNLHFQHVVSLFQAPMCNE